MTAAAAVAVASDDALVAHRLPGWSFHFGRGRGWRVIMGTMTAAQWDVLRPVIADEFPCHFVARAPWAGIPLRSVPPGTRGDVRVFCTRGRIGDAVACIASAVLLAQRTASAAPGSPFAEGRA